VSKTHQNQVILTQRRHQAINYYCL